MTSELEFFPKALPVTNLTFTHPAISQKQPQSLLLSYILSAKLSTGSVLLTGLLFYIPALVLYRLWFSPLARFPGPKLAAATGWYETYYEIVKKGGGQFTFQIKELHERYGPIVRISPWELHIHDSEYYDSLYTSSLGLDKSPHIQHRFGTPSASFSTPENDLHKIRRNAVLPFFSKRRIHEQAAMIQKNVDLICYRFKTEYAGTDNVVRMNDMLSSYGTDVIMTYAFNRSRKFLSEPGFSSKFARAIQGLKDFVHIAQQFPLVGSLSRHVPQWLLAFVGSDLEAIVRFETEISSHVQQVLEKRASQCNEDQKGTIFVEILNANLPAAEKSFARLKDEGIGIVGAAIETTKLANMVIIFHILHNPQILSCLQTELEEVIPDPESPPPLSALEKAPYLAACIQEGLRLAYGTTARSQRISRHRPLQYKNWIIPQNAMVGMDAYHMHHDETVFPNSTSFKPDRWLGNPKGPDGVKSLNRYMVAFSRGTRMCAGSNLALAQMTLLLAALFRNFDMELYETTRRDVDIYRDMVGLEAAPGSKGVRLRVKGCRT
ncbi:cytochrome P450 [Penicillium angulare]|uniref:Cytochrome P450 n=1 Tax=Penicillium angulare TaxID=116970 RepID=A0A9W9FHC5_9EURO|nr:cytochrome P450 [Penicillium angulare]